jgi:hypothetical protein
VSDADKPPLFDAGAFRQTAEVRARFVTSPETLAMLTPGVADVDVRLLAVQMPAAVLLTFRRESDITGRSSVDWSGPGTLGAQPILEVPRSLTMIEATLKVPVERTADGWQYKGYTVKVGGPLHFEAPLFTLRGWILSMRVSRQ